MRCNSGIHPSILLDQHLLAEQSEILMIPGVLKRNNWQYKTKMPSIYTLGKGHMTFWNNKLLYLRNRHDEIKKEVHRRGFKVTDLAIDIDEYPRELVNDWRPCMQDSQIVRLRIAEKILAKDKLFWRYEGRYIDFVALESYINQLNTAPLYYV
jgi:deoxyribonuclease (pyrimidine dimer)